MAAASKKKRGHVWEEVPPTDPDLYVGELGGSSQGCVVGASETAAPGLASSAQLGMQ